MKTERKCDRFLRQPGTWSGPFRNFVNQTGGVIQEGYIAVEVEIDGDEICHRNVFMDEKHQKSEYTGSGRMKVDGHRIVNMDVMTEDPNTKNPIRNHEFEGYLIDDHVFILETYDEILDGENVDRRRNHLHYFFPSENEIVMLGDVFVNDRLLVFAGATLKREGD